jgi:hypothetical protein
MTLSFSKETVRQSSDAKTRAYFSSFPMNSTLETVEQIRRFELLRLAFFVLKLRKLEQRTQIAQPEVGTRLIMPSRLSEPQARTQSVDSRNEDPMPSRLPEPQARTQSVWEYGNPNTDPTSAQRESDSQETEMKFRCNLLRHVIFQQVLTLIRLDAREQAMQIIDTCNKS